MIECKNCGTKNNDINSFCTNCRTKFLQTKAKTEDANNFKVNLKLKAVGVNFAIFTISDVITKRLQKDVMELNNLSQENINRMFFTVSYVSLFNAQRFFWENFIQDENNALIFEKYLFQMFENTMGVDPKPFIKDLVDYVGKDGHSREVQYIGSKLCKVLNKEDALLMFQISSVFSLSLIHGFFESMKKAWELPDKTLEEMFERIK